MYLRQAKIILIVLVGLFALLVSVTNISNYNANFRFVQHVLTMDTTFADNALRWRAIDIAWVHHASYWVIIAIEGLVGVLCLIGAYAMWQQRKATAMLFNQSKYMATMGLVLGIVLWFGGFMIIGAEWFLMWQSPVWNGQSAAFRFSMVIFATLIFLHQQEVLTE